jgi:hypothetical protein
LQEICAVLVVEFGRVPRVCHAPVRSIGRVQSVVEVEAIRIRIWLHRRIVYDGWIVMVVGRDGVAA